MHVVRSSTGKFLWVSIYLCLSVPAHVCFCPSQCVSCTFFSSFICWEANIIISIISFLFIILIMINTSSTYNISFMSSLHVLYNNTRVTCSSALSVHPSSSFLTSADSSRGGHGAGPFFVFFVYAFRHLHMLYGQTQKGQLIGNCRQRISESLLETPGAFNSHLVRKGFRVILASKANHVWKGEHPQRLIYVDL